MIISLILVAIVVLLDLVSKALLYGKSFSLIGDFLWIESAFNKGASFGMLQGGRVFFIIFTIPIVMFMFWIICSKKYKKSLFFKICISLILGGTLGNLIDRIFLGGVRDFIYLKSINFAIFNIADSAITVGVILFIICLLIDVIKVEKIKKENIVENQHVDINKSEENKHIINEDINQDSINDSKEGN